VREEDLEVAALGPRELLAERPLDRGDDLRGRRPVGDEASPHELRPREQVHAALALRERHELVAEAVVEAEVAELVESGSAHQRPAFVCRQLQSVREQLAQAYVALDVLAILAGVPAQDLLESRHERPHRSGRGRKR
jgi:hypothetical protein